ncbi:MAG: hypothetical protein AAGK47_04215, partial [Bacteroidota bacterium]
LFWWSCGGEASTTPSTVTTTTTSPATSKLRTQEEMQDLVRYTLETQRRIFSMPKEQSLSYRVGDNSFNFELYKEENGDTLAVVNNGSLGKLREFDRYIFYQNNRPVIMFVDQLKRDVSQQMFIQLVNFYDAEGLVEPTVMVRNNERKEDMMKEKFIPKDLGEVHSIYKYVQDFEYGMNNIANYTLYFDDFIREDNRSFIRFKAANEATDAAYLITAVRLPDGFEKDAALAPLVKNPNLYKNKKGNMKWEIIKMKNGMRIPQWVSGTFE